VDGPPALHPLNEAGGASEQTHSPEEINQERLLAFVSALIAACGIAIGWFVFKRRPLLQLPRVLENKYYVDEAYNAAIIHPIEVGSREGLWKLFDVGVIDGLLHSLGEAVTEAGRLVRRLQSGFVRGYAAIILVGALAMIGFFAYLGAQALGVGR
jgi:NADH-quinone oxidoreductase subunit L